MRISPKSCSAYCRTDGKEQQEIETHGTAFSDYEYNEFPTHMLIDSRFIPIETWEFLKILVAF